MAKVTFNPKLRKSIEEACKDAIDETTQAAAEAAAGTTMNLPEHTAAGHPWYAVTARVESAVTHDLAVRKGNQIVGSFGASKRRGDYAFLLERMNPYLRPVAAREFPKLAGRIRANLS